MNYKKNGASLSVILESGSTSISGFSSINKRTTSTSNSKPKPTNYLVNNVDIANTATAKHITVNSSGTYSKPTGATKLRYMIIGGGGGGGGGCGGAYNNDDGHEDHAILGHDGGHGGYGTVIENEIDVTSYSSINVTIGNRGNKGYGGSSKYTEPSDGQPSSGNAGNSGNSTILKHGTTTIVTAQGGGGGPGGPAAGRWVDTNAGNGSSWRGFYYSTKSTKNTGGKGNTIYGTSGNLSSYNGNDNLTTNAAENKTFKSGWENSLTQIAATHQPRSNGGAGGWGYGNGKNANSGSHGNDGAHGRACLIWLFDDGS